MSANIVLGVTGGIAAYKSVQIASNLTKLNHNVYTIMTESAVEFVSPLTFHSITHLPVENDLFTSSGEEVKHIDLADKADLFLIAPATANFIAKAAAGIADDLLTTVLLATQAPIMIAPSMNVHMFENPIVQKNMKTLADLGFNIITPDSGYLACGYTGKGRLPEPERLVEEVKRKLSKKDLKNKKVVITAGPTRESLDPVRFLSNYSSGKMGYALAKAASYRGAEVKLISGPSAVEVPLGVELAQIETAEEMKEAVFAEYKNADLVIMAAAVSDYRPQEIMTEKIKKSGENLVLKLERTTDILAELGKNKKSSQLLVGFAAESENLLENAQKKLSKKQADYIIANDISNQSIGFGSDKNQVSILSEESIVKLPTADKEKLAHQILNYILSGQKNQG
ncbi:Phosphopantothenate-cysteine ligase /Phosphopantothenoylcysteine decarboxylase [Halanaerobium congolense]|jgi:phosphopantothenoylcysteine decarboxylase/phosphopantothenate--cysteine ligase|uniref:Coenzyme A biosynthesis bifunctional protein CoaBC n=1 Tax=Halanaerobium congolense TaxID=54121 RepID=A0A1M7HJU6_9FIRM|nr:bifunctional phosphopantothenoylcysteine decarboxylase/phosphopantothenate--cysteine ligase CoaBC [Halanaerobium congolense]KXS49863.1 MAG: phosphopantothenoylcysteine decarboxylase / phosphopantothenate--cysteine ligase [Halanaerobium sp. T82-1]OEG63090.1 MAG: phosphopantothenoylcysteine decarboxylase [Halanaerobium sp. MDAL1]PUU91225.1 MAG: phosphopantothenoylcysteine decarboxylase / phosphopantothenate--cysteine ligase [Halanaerobium sp.]PTX16881.1 phosphopantothenate-cysteine ligase /pho